ncbi:TlyA family RNA methyltransferase [Saliterribacillus persicus]|uniref:23S rRNA (Cytidine1920-2'-O)/16S rRNA (Cytidine1409-2'-O)-methyltransferase n=1 Tax=Saliterribacillus persicus TaxID=930114 RepID=A0A368XG12_9BACI|nr:TlyA family RNA methyltransferase [Saliterribacillus persicus]RCW65417.1 23S rRNA (cytidine1920-2'-O)/16S rRNA (cytidine1409-2'-O)-methyltransferase [Saliterribacillus persicus]
MSKKIRLDQLLVDRGLMESREKAKRTIMAGSVFSNQQCLDKPGVKVDDSIDIEIKGKVMPYVGRGGFKLEKAIEEFQLNLKDRIMLDVGSSTGGFSDCALQNGVKLSYALDVGYNQLAWKLRSDERVIVMERTNFRHATLDMFQHGRPNFATVDVSFISLKLILPPLSKIVGDNSEVVILIKPQFEAGKDQVGKKGIVRDPSIHHEVLQKTLQFATGLGFSVEDLTFSPITGGDGNIEFLAKLYWGTEKTPKDNLSQLIDTTIEVAHQTFSSKT